jgi:uncharacterized membrane protein
MLPTKFRRQLRREADLWVEEGAIDLTFYQQLAHRYQFAALEVESRNSFITLLMGLGCVLIGMGVLTFVAANWQQLAREWRVLMLLSLFIAVNVAGFYLWREPNGGKQRLGQGLLLLGALILGGNMGLMGQMFHVRGDSSQLMIAWAIGVLLMAYSLRLTSLGIFAQILMGMGYWQIYTTGQWAVDRADIDPNWTYFVYQHMPIAAIILFLPLAYLCRSQAIFTLTGVAFVSAFQGNLLPLGMSGMSVMFALLCSLPPLLLWGYGTLAGQWQIVGEASPKENRRNKIFVFPQISRRLGIISLGLTCFTLSFSAFWGMFESRYQAPVLSPSSIWDGVIFALITIGIWAYLIWQTYRNSDRYPWNWMTTAIGGINCVMVSVIIAQINSIGSKQIYAYGIFCLLLFAVAIGLIRSGLANSDRGAFWLGLGLLTSRIIIWFLMTQNDLMTKSLLFIVCGIGVIAIGLWFERNVRRLNETKSGN